MQSKMWDERYAEVDYAYGETPNEFFKMQLDELKTGKILIPADGEGRNGVYAARSGWDVNSFDISIEGQKKALALAKRQNVEIKYLCGDFETFDFKPASFDAIGLIYAHFPTHLKSSFHQKFASLLKPGGKIIFEAFGKSNLPLVQNNPAIGGPRDVDMLFSTVELAADFKGFRFDYLKEELVHLNEGKYHTGRGSVVRCVATKL